jgi:hypothetical protein
MSLKTALPHLIGLTNRLLEAAPTSFESLQIIQGRALRHEYLDRLARKQSWPILALFKGQGPEAAYFTKCHEMEINRALNCALLVGQALASNSIRLVYGDLRLARNEIRWRAKPYDAPAIDLVATSRPEMTILIDCLSQQAASASPDPVNSSRSLFN